MKTILVTGSAGFIGFHLSKLLLSRGYSVIGLDNLNNYYDVQLKESRLKILKKSKNFSFTQLNLENLDKKEHFKNTKIDAVINLAAQAGVRHSIDCPGDYTNSNLVGFFNILEFVRDNIPRLIFASTSSVYGANTNFPFNESRGADHPIQFYAATKKANELMAHAYSSMYGLEAIGLRFFTVYGPYGRPDMALFKFTKNILAGKPIKLFNNGNHVRDFTYVDDIVEGIFLSLEYKFKSKGWDSDNPDPQHSKSKYRIYNLGNNKPIKLLDYLGAIENELGIKAKVEYLPLQQGDVIETQSDITHAINDLSYNPKVSIESGVKEFINWYKNYYCVDDEKERI